MSVPVRPLLRVETFAQAEELAQYWSSQNLTMRDGITLRYGTYLAATPRKGRVLILPDRDDFIEKYSELAENFAAHGWQTWCMEWRGQGRVHDQAEIEDQEEYAIDKDAPIMDRLMAIPAQPDSRRETPGWFNASLADLQEFWLHVWRDEAGQDPLMIVTSGLGSHLGLRWLINERMVEQNRCCLVAISPMLCPLPFSLPISPIFALALIMSVITPGSPYWGQHNLIKRDELFNTNRHTHDQIRFNIVQEWRTKYPELAPVYYSWSWLAAALSSCMLLRRDLVTGGRSWMAYYTEFLATLWKHRHDVLARTTLGQKLTALRQTGRRFRRQHYIRIPILAILTPANDVINGYLQYKLAGRFLHGRVIDCPEGKHDLLQEQDEIRDRVWREIDAFIAKVFDPSSSPTADKPAPR